MNRQEFLKQMKNGNKQTDIVPPCNFCNKFTHLSKDCYKNKTSNNMKSYTDNSTSNYCSICKKTNHNSDTCFFKNKRGNTQPNGTYTNTSSNISTMVNGINGNMSGGINFGNLSNVNIVINYNN